jgi:hypothetical protein
MKEKLILQRKKKPKNDCEPIIRVRADTKDIIDSVADESGLTKIDVVAKLIKFAADNIEWVRNDD